MDPPLYSQSKPPGSSWKPRWIFHKVFISAVLLSAIGQISLFTTFHFDLTESFLVDDEAWSGLTFGAAIKTSEKRKGKDSIERQGMAEIPVQTRTLFIGDSVHRNSFLQWLDHKKKSDGDGYTSPPEVSSPQLHNSWYAYCQYLKERLDIEGNCACIESTEHVCHTVNRQYTTTLLLKNKTNVVSATFLYMHDEVTHWLLSPSSNVESNKIGRLHNNKKQYFDWQKWLDITVNYVSIMEPQPTTIVISSRTWPTGLTKTNVRRILEALHYATKKPGMVLWRGGFIPLSNITENPSDIEKIDKTAEMWSYHLPWVVYQPFPRFESRHVDDVDPYLLSSQENYQRWNQQMESVIESPVKCHRVFLLVGGARTMESTVDSYFANHVLPLCPEYNCVSHLVTHLSSSDNRPSRTSDDPIGTVVAGEDPNIMTYLKNAPDNLRLHTVEGYNIGSAEEAAAMDLVESSISNKLVRDRLKLLRYGDPRRYSMWFARAWAWRTVESLAETYTFDFVAFTRPDLLWLTSTNTVNFFKNFGEMEDEEVWVHDVYFNDVPDTLALFTSIEAAKLYFSLEMLVQPNVACLGGPNFNQTLVAARLAKKGITIEKNDWCHNMPSHSSDQGWSERILRRKLTTAGLEPRYFSAGAVLLRNSLRPRFGLTTLSLECNSLNPAHHIGYATTHPNISGVPFVGCAQLARDIDSKFPLKSLNNISLGRYKPFYLQSKQKPEECLTLNNHTLQPSSCDLFDPSQVFTSSLDHDIVGLTFPCFKKSYCPKNAYIFPTNVENLSLTESAWEKVPVHLNIVYPYYRT